MRCLARGAATAVVCAVTLTAARPAAGDSFGPIAPVCQDFFDADVVFLGRLVSIEPEPLPPAGASIRDSIRVGPLKPRPAVVEVLEPFRGLEHLRPGDRLAVDTWMSLGDEPYLIYARREDGRLTIREGWRTRRLSRAAEDLAYARSVATNPATDARVYGALAWDEMPAVARGPLADEPLPQATIVLTGADGEHRLVTDDAGRFEARVPPGGYTARVELAGTFRASVASEFRIPDGRACRDLRVVVNWNGRISGRVVDAGGRPVVGLDVHATSPGQGRSFWIPRWTRTEADGGFVFDGLEPGQHQLRVGIDLLKPGTSVDAAGLPSLRELELDPAQHLDIGSVRLSPAVRTTTVRGVVVDQDGTPLVGAMMLIAEAGQEASLTEARTDAAGRYVFAVVPGRRYVVQLLLVPDQTADDAESAPIEAGTTAGPPPLVVRVHR